MPDADVIDAEIVEETEESRAVAVVPAVPTSLAVAPEIGATELVARMNVIREASEQAMEENVDFGRIPGTDKPTLLKPGAEKLGVLFQLDIQIANEKTWGPGDHLTVVSKATVYHAPSGSRLGFGEGICTTRERKYGVRQGMPTCPNCGKQNIRKSKNPNPQESFYCWAKKGGCGANFPEGQFTDADFEEIENPDLPDTWNTVVKMAEKRARVDAVLAVTGASALFTQDVEDLPQAQPQAAPQQQASNLATEGQRSFLFGGGKGPGLFDRGGATAGEVDQFIHLLTKGGTREGLTRHNASKLIEALKGGDDAPKDQPSQTVARWREQLAESASAGDAEAIAAQQAGADSPADTEGLGTEPDPDDEIPF